MPNDAKLGLVVGVALVLAVAVVFFRKDSATSDPADTNVKSAPAETAPPRRAVAQAMRRTQPAAPVEPPDRKHTVSEGDTFLSLAQRYYGDGDHFKLISRANHQDADATELLIPGTVLVIPEIPAGTSAMVEP